MRCSSDEWEFSLKNSSVLIYFIVIGESSSGHIGEDEWICSKLHFRFSDMRSNLEEEDEENVDRVFFVPSDLRGVMLIFINAKSKTDMTFTTNETLTFAFVSSSSQLK